MELGIVGGVLIAAVLVYDRLGGNHELSRRLFQVGLTVSLVFVVLAATAAFIRSDVSAGGALVFSSSGSSTNSDADKWLASSAVEYGVGVLFLVVGLVALRRYHTVPLAFVVSGVFLLFAGPELSAYTTAASLSRYGQESSQKVDVGVFVTALAGTIVLLGYGMQLERDFVAESEAEDDETGPKPGGESR